MTTKLTEKGLAVCGAFFMTLGLIHAGDNPEKKSSTETPATSPWSATLASGWDSLYMFRGVNQLPGFDGYGSSISWSALTMTWAPTASDSFTLASWAAFGLSESDYKEIDATATYTHSIGDLSISGGYALYTVLSAPNALYSHELSLSAAYEFRCGPATITPMLQYDYTLGPSPEHGGYIDPGASYLELRVDGELPIFKEIVKAAPWVATGFNFGYNNVQSGEDVQPFTGANHVEAGLTIPVAVSSAITLSPYIAYSHGWVTFPGTRPNTVWGGVSITFSF